MKSAHHLIPALALFFSANGYAFSGPNHVVYIGDSHSLSAFGSAITTWLRSRPETTYEFYASGGSAPLQWEINPKSHPFISACGYTDNSSFKFSPKRVCDEHFHTPNLAALLDADLSDPAVKDRKKIVIVAHGTNYNLNSEADIAVDLSSTESLIREITQHGFRCVWIGPPQMSRATFSGEMLNKRYDIIQKAIKTLENSCLLIDSRALSSYPQVLPPHPKPDGIHYDTPWYHSPEGLAAANDWGDKVVGILETLK